MDVGVTTEVDVGDSFFAAVVCDVSPGDGTACPPVQPPSAREHTSTKLTRYLTLVGRRLATVSSRPPLERQARVDRCSKSGASRLPQ